MFRQVKLYFLLLATVGFLRAQTVIHFQGFESSLQDNWQYRVVPDSLATLVSNKASEGTRSLRLRGSATLNISVSVFFDTVGLPAGVAKLFSISYAADGPDSGEDLWLHWSMDGGATWDSVKLVDGYNNKVLAFGEVDTSGLPYGSASMNPYIINIPAAVTSFAMRVVYVDSSTGSTSSDYYYIDAVRLYVDTSAPRLQWACAPDGSTVRVHFSQDIDPSTVTTTAFSLGGVSPATASLAKPREALLTFVAPVLTAGIPEMLSISGIVATNGKPLSDTSILVGVPAPYDVIISEVFPDPTPKVGLPDCNNCEWIELHNRAPYAVCLQEWKLYNRSNYSVAFPDSVLLPGDYAVVVDQAVAGQFSQFGKTIALSSWPYVYDDWNRIALENASGRLIYSLYYESSFYRDAAKNNGGWSLEMIDVGNPCLNADNWRASVSPQGGTPAQPNSVASVLPDNTAPTLITAYPVDSLTIRLDFDEKVWYDAFDSFSFYSISPYLGSVNSVGAYDRRLDRLVLSLTSPLLKGTIYTITVNGIRDCKGNTRSHQQQLGLPQPPDSFDVVINEIMFDPPYGSAEWVELYNRSNKIIDIKDLKIANTYCATDSLRYISDIDTTGRLMLPGDYLVLSSNPEDIPPFYNVPFRERLHKVKNMPYLSVSSSCNWKGGVAVLTRSLRIIDLVNYDEKWHHPIVFDNNYGKGVSLEKINPTLPSNSPHSWQSAASTVGYATPTYRNSQYMPLEQAIAEGRLQVILEGGGALSPDDDGFRDYLLIRILLDSTDYTLRVWIFDLQGRPVRELVSNALAGTQTTLKWDGFTDEGTRAPTGRYILYVEATNMQGKTLKKKVPFVLATRP